MGIWKFLNLPSRSEVEEQKEMISLLKASVDEVLKVQSRQIEELIEKQNHCQLQIKELAADQVFRGEKIEDLLQAQKELYKEILQENTNKVHGVQEKVELTYRELEKVDKLRQAADQGQNTTLEGIVNDLAHVQEGIRLMLVQNVLEDSENLLKSLS